MSSFSFAPPARHYKHIATNATTLVRTGPGILWSVAINSAGSGNTVTIYDGVDATGAVIAVYHTDAIYANVATTVTMQYGVAVATGITVVTSGGSACDLTVVYS